MRVALLVVALALIFASAFEFLWRGAVVGDVRTQRPMVTGHVRGDLPGTPWAGTVAMVGSEKVILGEDGAFSFAVLPGRHTLNICCSESFQAINREVVVTKGDLTLDLEVKPLREIKGRFEIQGGGRIPGSFMVLATLDGTNVVDRANTAMDGTFMFHLLPGNWEVHLDNLPSGYKVVSMTLGEEKVRDHRFALAKGTAALPLRIALQ